MWPEIDVTFEPGTTPRDEACSVDMLVAGSIPVDDACVAAAPPVTEPWSLAVEWEWRGLASAPQFESVFTTPRIANLTDDNADGVVDDEDVPDVVVVALGHDIFNGRLVVVDGGTGVEHWAVGGFGTTAGITLGDVSGDGVPEILATDVGGGLRVLDAQGAPVWQSSVISPSILAEPVVTDLEGDGVREVLFGRWVLRATTGEVLRELPVVDEYAVSPVAVDLDLDGTLEIALGSQLFEADGTERWAQTWDDVYFPQVVVLNADADPEGEVLLLGADQWKVLDPDGSTLFDVALGGTESDWPSAACAADLDGDGQVEVAYATDTLFQVREIDGGASWTADIDDHSGASGCATWDVDGDGLFEVLYADQHNFWIFDGVTGEPRYEDDRHASGTLSEYPVVADVDGDGSAEIIIAANSISYQDDWTGLVVLGQEDDGWPRVGSSWPSYDYAGSASAAPWLGENLWHGRPHASPEPLSDITLTLADACVDACDVGMVRLSVVIANAGPALSDPVELVVYADDGGTLTPVQDMAVGQLQPGEAAASVLIEVDVTRLGSHGLRVEATADGECRTSNNQISWDEC